MKRREYNVRIIIDEKNQLHLGSVCGFYNKGKKEKLRGKDLPVISMEDVPDSVRRNIARRLAIINY